MSKKNPHTFTSDRGLITHKRFPRQARTRREVDRIRAGKNKITFVSTDYLGGTFTEVKKEAQHA